MYQVSWPLSIAVYLFLAGAGAAAFYSAYLVSLFSGGRYQKITKYGAYISIPAMAIGILFLIVDLGKPLRFFEILFYVRPSSILWIGSWIITLFSIMAFLNVLTWLAEDKIADSFTFLQKFRGKEGMRKTTGILGMLLGFMVAAYTGVVLGSTSIALWSATPFLGLLFVMSATSTGVAALVIVCARSYADRELVTSLAKADAIIIVLEAVSLGILMLGLNKEAPGVVGLLTAGRYGVLFWLGVVACGLLIPLLVELFNFMSARHQQENFSVPVVAAALVLIGGFLLRYVILFAGQQI